MFLIALTFAVIVILFIGSSFRTRQSRVARPVIPTAFPPRVPSVLPWLGSALNYILRPTGFLAQCQERYGSAYSLLLGGRDILVVSSGDAISSVFTSNHRLLCNDLMHYEMFRVVAGARTNYERLHEVMIHRLFPLVDKSLSRRSLGQVTEPFGRVLFAEINKYTEQHDLRAVSLMQLLQEPLYVATNAAIFGSTFPLDSYADFHTLDKSVPLRFSKLPFWFWPSMKARERLLARITDYLFQEKITDCDEHFASGFIGTFKENEISLPDAARLVLTFMWGLHSNTMSTAFWLFSYLLADVNALARVRAEIDLAFGDKFTDLQALLEASPNDLDSPSFALLTSAIMETMRLTALHAAVRLSECDFELKDGETTIPIRKGEYILGNVHAAHMDESNYSKAHQFVVDRFVDGQHHGRLATDGKPFFSLGGGKHICKGRWLAIYEIKILAISLLRLFDISPAQKGSLGWSLPKVHKRSIGVTHTKDEVFVQLHPRQLASSF